VLVKNGRVVGEGYHVRAGEAHAEIHALNQAGSSAKGATAYVTLEPCSHQGRTPPCADALIKANVARVVAAMQDPNPNVSGRGMKRIAEAGIQVASGLFEDQARDLNQGFVYRMTEGRPFVRLKMAMSVDGRTAMESGESQWITGPDARRDVQRWRARASAILTSTGTVQQDNPRLTVRESELLASRREQPARVVLDSKRVLSGSEAVFDANAQVIHVVADQSTITKQVAPKAGVEVLVLPLNEHGHFSAKQLMTELAQREINEVFVEAGAGLAGDLLAENLVDELLIYMAPKMMGSAARGLALLPLERMDQAIELELNDLRMLGCDVRMRYRLKRK
jgi:diaminohydroxyphosphoribosylaminopyrimidine deaminase/5-amino-6-(5-phosphoribosylamino)uracil reductase